jgi:hypothetical protein
MSDTAPDTGVTEEQAIEAPEGASSTPEDAPEAPAYPWSSEHPEWSPEDAWKAYGEARTLISRGEHKQTEQPAQEEQPYDPYSELPAGDDPALVQDLAEIYAGQKSFQGGAYGPQAVMDWLAKSDAVSQATKGQFLQAWGQQDYWSAQAWMARHTLASERDQIREEFRQEISPAVEQAEATLNTTAITIAAQQFPDWEAKWLPAVVKYTEEENPAVFKGLTTAEQKAQRISDIVFLLAGREQHAQLRQQAAPQAPPPAAATTQTRSRGTADTAQAKRQADAIAGMQRVKGLV